MTTIAFSREVDFEEPNGKLIHEGEWKQISGPTSELKMPYYFSEVTGDWVEEEGRKFYREKQIATL